MILKYDLRKYLVSEFLDSRKFCSAAKEKMRQVFANHQTYRQHFGFPSSTGKLDISWQDTWAPSTMQVSKFIEDMIFGKEYDAALRGALRSKTECAEILDLEKFSEVVSQIDEDLEAEADASNESGGAPDVSVDKDVSKDVSKDVQC